MTATSAATVDADRLVVRTAQRVLVGPLTFHVCPGTTVGLRGPSGSGKSTVLRALVGLLPAGLTVEGGLCVLGRRPAEAGRLSDLRAQAGLVGQSPVVFPGSVLDNALFGLRHVVRAPRACLRERAVNALEEAGLWAEVADRLDSPAAQLSVGQRQRLCLARALALDPALLLLDEPTSALDAGSREVVEASVASLRGRRTVLLVSHDADQIARLCDAVVDLAQPAWDIAGSAATRS
ncbi:MAG: ATP-binding cassette domain-containing protein [Actinobacteria bacterium]|nr:ATP-binding cassette domain-containing protein [Actinomycetota bacterium]MBW3646918.1 ATP-binding cassette domain-containing protein [Actinomycetota bacterium]